MKAFRRCSRILILCSLCAFAPLFMLSYRLKHINDDASAGFAEDLSIIKHRTEAQILSAKKQEGTNSKLEPARVVYRYTTSNAFFNLSREDGNLEGDRDEANETDIQEINATRHDINEGIQGGQHDEELPVSEKKSHADRGRHDHVNSTLSSETDRKVREMQDQLLSAKVYLSFIPSNSTSHFVKELKLRVKELKRAMESCLNTGRFSRSAGQKMKAMDSALRKASHMFPDCTTMIKRLRAMSQNTEEQIVSQKKFKMFLTELVGRTIPKGHHCLSLKLTSEYFALEQVKRVFPHEHLLVDPSLHHFAIFSDNVLACSVVVNSTFSSARDPEKIVFHIVTDSLNFAAMTAWFLFNSPAGANVHVESMESFNWLSTKYNATFPGGYYFDQRFSSELNYLRFYLPDIFSHLHKIVLLDHDVVVQRDLSELWHINMRGKVNGAVQTCEEGESNFRRMDMLLNFTDPFIADNFDPNECTWAFGLNLFDLQEWRRQNLTGIYHKYLHLGNERPLWRWGSLPIGWITFYHQTITLDKTWHVLGLGQVPHVSQEEIDEAAVIHFDGPLKPWVDTGLDEYKGLWRKYVNYEHPYLQHCNIRN